MSPFLLVLLFLCYDCIKTCFTVTFPCIGVNFILERNYAYHIVQIYVPSILIVILSWVNFWLDCTSVPARVALSLLTVLTITTQSSGARQNLPRVSYIKASYNYIFKSFNFRPFLPILKKKLLKCSTFVYTLKYTYLFCELTVEM